MITNTLRTLIKVGAVPGREDALAREIRAFVASAADECYTDALGNLVCLRRGSLPSPRTLMLTAHMDASGFLTTYIEETGAIRFAPLGEVCWQAAAYSPVIFENGATGILLPEKGTEEGNAKPGQYYVDIGASGDKEAARHVSVGDFFLCKPRLDTLGTHLLYGRPLDDRVGCAILVELLCSMEKPLHNVCAVFTVQQTVGGRGAGPAAFALAPDYAISLDLAAATDQPGDRRCGLRLGGGAALQYMDGGVVCDPRMTAALERLARAQRIPVQYDLLSDDRGESATLQKSGKGAATAALRIAARNLHTGAEMVDCRDLGAMLRLLRATAESDFPALFTAERN